MASATAKVSGATAAAAASKLNNLPVLDRILQPTLESFHASLTRPAFRQAPSSGKGQGSTPGTRIACLDVTAKHISVSLSDADQTTAAPFGVLCRTTKPSVDARLLASAMELACSLSTTSVTPIKPPEARQMPRFAEDEQREREQIKNNFVIEGLVINVPPVEAHTDFIVDYTRSLLQSSEHTNRLLPGLKACILYSEAHAYQYTLWKMNDFVEAVKLLPKKLENVRRSKFDAAMFPTVTKDQLIENNQIEKDRISASEVLQAVLDDLAKLDRTILKERNKDENR